MPTNLLLDLTWIGIIWPLVGLTTLRHHKREFNGNNLDVSYFSKALILGFGINYFLAKVTMLCFGQFWILASISINLAYCATNYKSIMGMLFKHSKELLLTFTFLTGMFLFCSLIKMKFNGSDDPAYLHLYLKLIQTGSMHEFFNMRRTDSFGGWSQMEAIFFPLSNSYFLISKYDLFIASFFFVAIFNILRISKSFTTFAILVAYSAATIFQINNNGTITTSIIVLLIIFLFSREKNFINLTVIWILAFCLLETKPYLAPFAFITFAIYLNSQKFTLKTKLALILVSANILVIDLYIFAKDTGMSPIYMGRSRNPYLSNLNSENIDYVGNMKAFLMANSIIVLSLIVSLLVLASLGKQVIENKYQKQIFLIVTIPLVIIVLVLLVFLKGHFIDLSRYFTSIMWIELAALTLISSERLILFISSRNKNINIFDVSIKIFALSAIFLIIFANGISKIKADNAENQYGCKYSVNDSLKYKIRQPERIKSLGFFECPRIGDKVAISVQQMDMPFISTNYRKLEINGTISNYMDWFVSHDIDYIIIRKNDSSPSYNLKIREKVYESLSNGTAKQENLAVLKGLQFIRDIDTVCSGPEKRKGTIGSYSIVNLKKCNLARK